MGTVTMQNVRDASYKLLNEYQTVTANIDLNVVNRVDEQINLAYWELCTKDKVSASFWISQFPISNLLYPSSNINNIGGWCDCPYDGGMFITDSYLNTALTYNAASAASYYFEVDNNCDVDIKDFSSAGTAVTLSTLNIAGISIFTQYVGFITALSAGDAMQLSFYTTGGTFNVKNVALYSYTFSGVTASIPYYQPYVEYDIPSSYYDINRVRSRIHDDYRNFTDYRIDNDVNNQRRVLIPRGYRGEFVFEYFLMPSAVVTGLETFQIRDAYAYIIPWAVAGSIMMAGGFNAKVGQMYMQLYEQKKNAIMLSHDYGLHKLDNIRGW